MKKLFAIILALTVLMSLSTTAFAAAGDYTDVTKASFTVKYTANSGTAPTETFSFSEFTCSSVTDAAAGVTTANAPKPTKIADFDLASGGSKVVVSWMNAKTE